MIVMEKTTTIKLITDLDEMLSQFDMVHHLGYPESIEDYKNLLIPMLDRSYKQIFYYEEDKVLGLAGFWVNTKLFSGKYIDVDNVVVHPDHRSRNIGKHLMDWIENYGKSNDVKMIVLDAFSGAKKAHKFYFKEGYEIKGFHFTKDL